MRLGIPAAKIAQIPISLLQAGHCLPFVMGWPVHHPARSGSLGIPDPEQLPDQHELPDMVGRVVADQYELPQIGLPRAVRDPGGEIALAVEREPAQIVPVTPVAGDALVPGSRSWWGGAFRPVVRWPLALLIGRVHAKIEDVELRQPQMLDELP